MRQWIVPAMWFAWAGYWFISARRVKRTKQSEIQLARIFHLALAGVAFALVALPVFRTGPLSWRFLPHSDFVFFTGTGILAAGLGFAVCARVHLGQYWSGTITLKEGHRLIRTGPYALARHPIYTGFLTGFFGTAITCGEWRGVVAFVLLLVVYLLKIRREEDWLTREFGEEYVGYRNEVRGLLPLPRFSRKQIAILVLVILMLLSAGAYFGRGTLKSVSYLVKLHRLHVFELDTSARNYQPAHPFLAEVRLLSDLSCFNRQRAERNEQFKPELKPLVKEMTRRQTEKKNVSYSYQIYREIRWRLNFTSDTNAVAARIADLKKSLENEGDQDFADQQSPVDGSWGAGYSMFFMKLYGTVEALSATENKQKTPQFQPTFLDRINSPEKLTNYMASIVRDEFYKTGTINRWEVDDSVSDLSKLILRGIPKNYSYHPQLREAYLKFLDDWRNPETGCWGLWFVGKDGAVWKTDDVGITLHIVDRREGKVNHLDKITRRVLELSDVDFPFGIRMNGRYENHMNWDAVIIFKYAWPNLDEPTRAAVRAEISRMLDWCLAESYQPDGAFKLSEMDDTFGDAMEYGVYFLAEIGFFNPRERFWTDRDFPGAKTVHDAIKARISSVGLKDSEVKHAYERLIEVE